MCQQNALALVDNPSTGCFDIVIDKTSCLACGDCVAACPAHKLPFDECSREQLHSAQQFMEAFASDKIMRNTGSTGGVARATLISLLKTGFVDAVYSLYKNVAEPNQEAFGSYYTTGSLLESIPQSLYRPIPWGRGVTCIDGRWQRLLFIGLPCQLKGVEKIFKNRFPALQIFKVALICRQQKTAFYTDYVKKILGASGVETARITYRGSGWPGKLGILGRNSENFPGFLASGEAFGNNLWRVPGCKYCGDCLGGNIADITLADPWNHISEEEDPEGTNIVIVWTQNGTKMIHSSSSFLTVRPVTFSIVEKILMFGVIDRKKHEIALRLGKNRHLLSTIMFVLKEKKVEILERVLLRERYDSLKVKIMCRLLKKLR